MPVGIEKEIVEYQKAEKQLQAVMAQRLQFEMQLQEIENALKELDKAKDEVYKASGGIMVKTTKEDAIKELNDKKELLTVRLKSLKEQEEKLKNNLMRLAKKLEDELKNAGG